MFSDYDLALKFFLRASEMETDPEHLELYKTNSRTWWGVKLVSHHVSFGRNADMTVNETTVGA